MIDPYAETARMSEAASGIEFVSHRLAHVNYGYRASPNLPRLGTTMPVLDTVKAHYDALARVDLGIFRTGGCRDRGGLFLAALHGSN